MASILDGPHYEIPAAELAAWLERVSFRACSAEQGSRLGKICPARLTA
jgi:hypothetical protein